MRGKLADIIGADIMVHAQTRGAALSIRRVPASAAAVLLVAVLGLSACGHSGDQGTGYLAKRADRIVFVEWTQAEGATSSAAHLNGSATLALIDTKKFNLETDVASFTGTMAGSTVALALSKPLDASSSWSGTLSGDLLTLSYTGTGGASVSLTLHSASQDEYNSAIATEQQALADLKSGKTAATTADKGKAGIEKWSAIVQKDLDKVAADAAAVTPAVGAVTSANARADSDKESARRWMNKALNHQFAPQVCPAADSASGAANSASGEAGAASAGETNVNNLADVVKKDIVQLSSDHGQLSAAELTLPDYKPKGLPSDDDIESAIKSANDTINSAIQSANGASRAAAGKASTAQSFASQAQAACASAPQEKPSPSPSPS
jgi:hypothetical protein